MAWVLQSQFDCGEEDAGLAGDISIETRSRRRRFFKMASVSFESRTVSSETTSWHRPVRRRGASEGAVQDDDIFIDIDEVFAGLEVLPEFSTQRHSIRLRFPLH